MPSLNFIDIRDSKLNYLDLRSCNALKQVVKDTHQNLIVNDDVKITEYTLPVSA